MDGNWKIWFERFVNGKRVGAGVWHLEYKYKRNAVRRAKAHFDKPRVAHDGTITTFTWTVSRTNPWGSNTYNHDRVMTRLHELLN